jgi:hypothetical protein
MLMQTFMKGSLALIDVEPDLTLDEVVCAMRWRAAACFKWDGRATLGFLA